MDPRTLTKEEAELTRLIADTIVEEEVMKPMEAISWQHGTPPKPVPFAGDNPPPAETVTTPQETPKPEAKTDNPPEAKPAEQPVATTLPSEIDWESLRDSETGLIAKKYKTPQDAVKGMAHVVAMAKDAFTRTADYESLQRENAELKAKTSFPSLPAPVPELSPAPTIDTSALDAIVDEIIKEGGTIDEEVGPKLKEAVKENARNVARATVKEILDARDAATTKENNEWLKADAYMRKTYPDSMNFVDEISVFVQSDPVASAGVSALVGKGQRVEASVLAWKLFSTAHALEQRKADENTEIKGEAAAQVRKEAVDAARKDAGVMTTMASGVHETPNLNISEEEVVAAMNEMRRTGDAPGSPGGARWRALTIARDLNDPVFDSFS